MNSQYGRRVSLAVLCTFFAFTALATNAPTNLAASGASSSQVSLNWTDNSTDEAGFTFAYDTNAAQTNPSYVWAGGANTTSYSHGSLNAATTYYYKIKAEGNPDSTWTGVVGATTAPANLNATAASNSQVNLSWTGNASNSSITGYTYSYASNSSFTGATYVWVAGNGSNNASRTGLATATTYWFRVKAEGTTDALDSPNGNVVAVTTTPASLGASAASSSQINVSWAGNSGNTNITGYTLAYATDASFNGAIYKYVTGAGATGYSLTGLYAGTTYYLKVKAEGTSDAYDSPFTGAITASTSSSAPNAPSNLAASVVSSTQVNLSWTDNSTNETGFEIKRATDSAFTQNVVWVGAIQGTTYSDTSLTASTTYYYKVRAEGATQDSAYSSPVSATTMSSGDTIPTAPSSLSATAVSGTQVNLTWTDNSSNETGFEIKRATDSGFTQNVVWIGGIQGPSYSNSGLNPSTTYYYKVRAEGTAGQSAYSSAANATTSGGVVGMTISPHFAGINAWMPYQIGLHKYYGKLDQHWGDVQASGAHIVRYGGNGVDHYADPMLAETKAQYLAMVDTIRGIGAEPALEVPYYQTYTASQAADLVSYINVTNGRAVKYWIIANEPNLSGTGYGTGLSATDIATYVKDYASAMKAVDPSIKIIAPEVAWYDSTILNSLTQCPGGNDITGADPSGHYYVDILSFHSYGFNGSQTRQQVIDKLMSAGSLNDNLTSLNSNLANCTSYHNRSANPLQIAITEANVDYQNPSGESSELLGNGAKSFIGGQFWAEMMGIAMRQGVDFITFWSVIEGNGLSYLTSDGSTRLPTWEHFRLVAQNFRGASIASSDNNYTNVKTLASKDVDQIAVMILNQESSSTLNYTLRLDNSGSFVGTNPLKISVDAGLAVESNGSIAPQATVLLIFNTSGTLVKRIDYKINGSTTSYTETP